MEQWFKSLSPSLTLTFHQRHTFQSNANDGFWQAAISGYFASVIWFGVQFSLQGPVSFRLGTGRALAMVLWFTNSEHGFLILGSISNGNLCRFFASRPLQQIIIYIIYTIIRFFKLKLSTSIF